MAYELCPKPPSPCSPKLVMVSVSSSRFLPPKMQGLGLYSWNSFPIPRGGALAARFHIVQKIRPWKSQECSISRPKGEPYLMVTPTWQARWYWITDSSPSVAHMLGLSWVRKNTNSRKPSISVLLWSTESQSSTLRICLWSPLCFLLFWVLGQSSIP